MGKKGRTSISVHEVSLQRKPSTWYSSVACAARGNRRATWVKYASGAGSHLDEVSTFTASDQTAATYAAASAASTTGAARPRHALATLSSSRSSSMAGATLPRPAPHGRGARVPSGRCGRASSSALPTPRARGYLRRVVLRRISPRAALPALAAALAAPLLASASARAGTFDAAGDLVLDRTNVSALDFDAAP